MKSPDLTDSELLFLEGIRAAEAGDQALARDLLRLARILDGEGPPLGLPLRIEIEDAEPGELPQPRAPGGLPSPDDIEDADLLVQQGIAAAESADRLRALDLLSGGLTLDEGNVRGWLWLSSVVEDPGDKAFCLRRVLDLDPGHELARQGLAGLQEQDLDPGHELAQQGLAWLRDQEQVQEPYRPATPAPPEAQAAPQEADLPRGQAGAVGAGAIPGEAIAAMRSAATGVDTVSGDGARWVGRGLLGGMRLFPRSEFALFAVLGLLLLALIVSAELAGPEGLPAPL